MVLKLEARKKKLSYDYYYITTEMWVHGRHSGWLSAFVDVVVHEILEDLSDYAFH